MFSKVYEKFQNVQDGISSRFRGLSLGELPSPESPGVYSPSQPPGRDLLASYQENWKWIRSFSEVNAILARDVDKRIGSLHSELKRKNAQWAKFNKELTNLESIITSTEMIVNNIGKLRNDISELEENLINLENLIEMENHYKREENEVMKLNLYREHKLHNLDRFRANLALEHESRIHEREAIENVVHLAKSEVYQKKFEEDMESYRNTGQIPMGGASSSSSSKTQLKLENIEIDENTKENLDKYLL